ncbi:MAG: hypothetical protein IJ849_07405 [Selenomonadaceae bacterium]|nr:hypothetical protein [Selenomonadaceae bacterium]
MTMTAKKFTWCYLLAVVIMLIATAGYNYFFDISGLFNDDFSYYRLEPNQHFVKMRYILANPHKYNAYLFGSSRVGNINLTQINDGYRYYNMTYSGGVPYEFLNDVKILLRHQVSIDRIIVGLDDFDIYLDPAIHEKEYLQIPYHDDGNLRTYLAGLFRQPSTVLWEGLDDKRSIYDIYGSGNLHHEKVDKAIDNDVAAHISKPSFLDAERNLPQTLDQTKATRTDQALAEIAELNEIAAERNINLIFFFNPLQYTRYLSLNRTDLNDFKRRLAHITDYYDFSGLNDMTTNNYYYYETIHYRPVLGDMIVQRIFRPEEGTSFGVYVTQANVEEHIKNLEEQVS